MLMSLKILHAVYVFLPGYRSRRNAESACVHCGREPQQFQLSELDAQGSDFPRSLELIRKEQRKTSDPQVKGRIRARKPASGCSWTQLSHGTSNLVLLFFRNLRTA